MLISLLRSNCEFFENIPLEKLSHLFYSDLNLVENSMPKSIYVIIMLCVRIFSILITVSVISPLFLISFLTVFGLLFLCEVFYFWIKFCLKFNIKRFILKRFHASFHIQSSYLIKVCNNKVAAFYAQSLRGVKVIRAFAKQDTMEAKFQELMDELLIKIHVKYSANR